MLPIEHLTAEEAPLPPQHATFPKQYRVHRCTGYTRCTTISDDGAELALRWSAKADFAPLNLTHMDPA